MARKPRRIDFYAAEWLEGTFSLVPAEIALYIQICAKQYATGNPVDDDLKFMARLCNGDVRTMRRARDRLVELGKLTEVQFDGRACLSNPRAAHELGKAHDRIGRSGSSGEVPRKSGGSPVEVPPEVPRKSGPVSNENKDLAEPPRQPATDNHQPTTYTPAAAAAALTVAAREGESPTSLPPDALIREQRQADEAHALWLPVASALGLPDPGFLNGERRALLTQRLLECGGIEGWQRFLANLPKQGWLMSRHVKPSLAWLLKAETFSGVMENRYAESFVSRGEEQRAQAAARRQKLIKETLAK